jgi:peptidoglycan/LPS O-acetylase OafA/YrhL
MKSPIHFNNFLSIVDNRSTTGSHFYTNFDGLRAFAAFMVLNMHFDTVKNMASGAPGVFLFFGLSGFLLYSGFLSIKELNSRSIVAYLVRRIFRILPLYIVFVLTFAYLYKGWNPDFKFTWTVGHLLFLQGKIHLWTIRAEMIFYLSLPFVIVALSFFRLTITRFSLLMIIAGLVMLWLEDYFAMFFIGMAAVHARAWITPKIAIPIAYISLLLIVLLSSYTEITAPIRQFFGVINAEYMYRYGLVFFPLCFFVILGLSQFQSRFFSNRWMRLLGVCGYGIYLWHILILYVVREWQLEPWQNQFTLYGLTIALSIITYILVEKPGINVGRRIAQWVNLALPVFSFRPAWICLIIFSIALGMRVTYSDSIIKVQVDIWSSIDAIAHVDLNNSENTQYYPKSFPLKAEKWTRASFSFWDQKVTQIRFDFSEKSGKYKIKNFQVKFTYDNKKTLGLDKFDAEQGTIIALQDELLTVITAKNSRAPVLIYDKEDLQPWLRATKFGFFMVPIFTIGFILISILLDRLLLMKPRTKFLMTTLQSQSRPG